MKEKMNLNLKTILIILNEKIKTQIMIKRHINLYMLFIVAILSSCQNNGKKVESTKAETVNIVSTVNTATYKNIKKGSFLKWRASHLGGIDKRRGEIYYKDATILVNKGKLTNINITINMDKLTVDDLPNDDAKELSEHLKSADFFNIEKYPTSKFELTKLETIQGKYNSKITGNLLILDVSKNITFNASINVSEREVSIKSEDFSIDRAEWGLTYHAEGAKGVPLNYLISDDIGFTVDITVLK